MGLYDTFPYSEMYKLNMTWIIETIKKNTNDVEKAVAEIQAYQADMNAKFEALEEVQKEQIAELMTSWNQKIDYLLKHIIPQLITFGLTDDGYFVAYIPEQWQDIQFFTDTSDFNAPEFGRLGLMYNVN